MCNFFLYKKNYPQVILFLINNDDRETRTLFRKLKFIKTTDLSRLSYSLYVDTTAPMKLIFRSSSNENSFMSYTNRHLSNLIITIKDK